MPLSDPADQRTVFRSLRLSPREWEEVQRRMEAAGERSFGAYARGMLLHGELRVVVRNFDPREVRAELARIGNNLNQVARHAHMENRVAMEDARQARRLMEQVQELLIESLRDRG